MMARVALFSLISFALGAGLFSTTAPISPTLATNDRAQDREAIRQHIGSIFQAFIDWDVDKLYATHSEDWRGYLEGTPVPIKGIDEYMRANGVDWPKDKGLKPSPNPARGYKMKDFDVMFHGPDLAVVCFMGEFEKKDVTPAVTTNRFRIMDVYAKRNGGWIQVASHTVVDPDWRAEQQTKPANLGPQARERILAAREAVWRAYFTNDQAALEKMIPAEAIALDGGAEGFSDRARILAGAKSLAERGGKLIKLEFPKTEMQVYGNTIIIYTTYLYELEVEGKRMTTKGRGTEIFVRRGDELVNSGWHLDDE
jgi:hypothetical protein